MFIIDCGYVISCFIIAFNSVMSFDCCGSKIVLHLVCLDPDCLGCYVHFVLVFMRRWFWLHILLDIYVIIYSQLKIELLLQWFKNDTTSVVCTVAIVTINEFYITVSLFSLLTLHTFCVYILLPFDILRDFFFLHWGGGEGGLKATLVFIRNLIWYISLSF